MSGKRSRAQAIVMGLQSWVETLPSEALRHVYSLRDHALSLAHENNALRRNNERLMRRLQDAEDMNDTLRGMLKDANSANATAQTMAEHWRLKAQGGNYDATQEEQ